MIAETPKRSSVEGILLRSGAFVSRVKADCPYSTGVENYSKT